MIKPWKVACMSLLLVSVSVGCEEGGDGRSEDAGRERDSGVGSGGTDGGGADGDGGGGRDGGDGSAGGSACPADFAPDGVVDLAPRQMFTSRLMQDEDFLYVAERTTGVSKALRKIAKADGAVAEVVTIKQRGDIVSVDEAHVYYAEASDSDGRRVNLKRISKAGGTPETMTLPAGVDMLPGTSAFDQELTVVDAGTHLVWLVEREALSGVMSLYALDKASKTITHVLDSSEQTGAISQPTAADGIVYMGSNLTNLTSFPTLWSWPLSGSTLVAAGKVGLGARVLVQGTRVLSLAGGLIMEGTLRSEDNPSTVFNVPSALLPVQEGTWQGDLLYYRSRLCGALLEISTTAWSSRVLMAGELDGSFVVDATHVYYLGKDAAGVPVIRKAPL